MLTRVPEIVIGSKVWIMIRGQLRITQHNRKIGSFFSTPRFTGHENELLPLLPNPDGGAVSPFMMTTTANYMVEYNLEMFRRQHCPNKPSRLGCVFVFDSQAEAEKAMAKHGWRGEMFERARVSALLGSHRGDMSIVTHMRHLHANSMTDPTPFMHAYWSGTTCPPYELQKFWSSDWEQRGAEPGPIWETLIDGAIEFGTDESDEESV